MIKTQSNVFGCAIHIWFCICIILQKYPKLSKVANDISSIWPKWKATKKCCLEALYCRSNKNCRFLALYKVNYQRNCRFQKYNILLEHDLGTNIHGLLYLNSFLIDCFIMNVFFFLLGKLIDIFSSMLLKMIRSK